VFEIAEVLKNIDSEVFNGFPNLVKQHETISSVPQIRAYMESSRFIARPFFHP
jgi:hypothetical protein